MTSDVIVGVIYRHPGKSFDIVSEQLNLMFQRMSGENKTLYLMGGFQYLFSEFWKPLSNR